MLSHPLDEEVISLPRREEWERQLRQALELSEGLDGSEATTEKLRSDLIAAGAKRVTVSYRIATEGGTRNPLSASGTVKDGFDVEHSFSATVTPQPIVIRWIGGSGDRRR